MLPSKLNPPNRPRLALILGSGFSKAFGLPTTKDLSSSLLDIPAGGFLRRNGSSPPGVDFDEIDLEISATLQRFWMDVCGYEKAAPQPSLEDHFTIIDLAANGGHHLGTRYPPKKLRAIRRMSIHRVFQLINHPDADHVNEGELLLRKLRSHFCVGITCLNWDLMVEQLCLNYAGKPHVTYGILVKDIDSGSDAADLGSDPMELLKLHGSANWVYCDNCRSLWTSANGKPAIEKMAYLED